MEGMVGPSSGGYQGVSQIWAISTGGETYRGEMPGLLGGVHVLMSALLSYCTTDRKKRSNFYSYIGIEHVLKEKNMSSFAI